MNVKKILFSISPILLFSGCGGVWSFNNTSDTIQKIDLTEYSQLHTLVRLNNLELIKKIRSEDLNATINKKDSFNETPLVDAVRSNFTEITKFLVCNGANKEVIDNHGYKLSDMAIRSGNSLIFDYLTKDTEKICAQKQEEIKVLINDEQLEESKVGNVSHKIIDLENFRPKTEAPIQSKEDDKPSMQEASSNVIFNGDIALSTENSLSQATLEQPLEKKNNTMYKDNFDGVEINDDFLDAYIASDFGKKVSFKNKPQRKQPKVSKPKEEVKIETPKEIIIDEQLTKVETKKQRPKEEPKKIITIDEQIQNFAKSHKLVFIPEEKRFVGFIGDFTNQKHFQKLDKVLSLLQIMLQSNGYRLTDLKMENFQSNNLTKDGLGEKEREYLNKLEAQKNALILEKMTEKYQAKCVGVTKVGQRTIQYFKNSANQSHIELEIGYEKL